jgi:4a-hydroxytetrahydrobiopterin dehydratase
MNGWEERADGLCKRFVFDDFVTAFSFMTRVALVAERMGHHPNWSNAFNTVTITLNTHDADGRVTERDHLLARAIDMVA